MRAWASRPPAISDWLDLPHVQVIDLGGLDRASTEELGTSVAGLRPTWTTIEAIPASELEARRAELIASDTVQGKPESVRAQIVDGQLKKWFSEVVLVEQPFRDQDRTVGQLIVEAIAKTGENIKVRRFVRFELGEEM